MVYSNDSTTMQVTRSLALSSEQSGAMICIKGNAIGTMVTLQSDKEVIVGRDQTKCNYVIADPKVSRVHFSITYLGTINKYLVVDYSTNGITLQNGQKLQKNSENYLSSMEELQIGDNVYKLK